MVKLLGKKIHGGGAGALLPKIGVTRAGKNPGFATAASEA